MRRSLIKFFPEVYGRFKEPVSLTCMAKFSGFGFKNVSQSRRSLVEILPQQFFSIFSFSTSCVSASSGCFVVATALIAGVAPERRLLV